MESTLEEVLTPKEFARKLYAIVYGKTEESVRRIERDYEDSFRSGAAWGLRDKYATLLSIATGISANCSILRKWGGGIEFANCPARIQANLHKFIPYYEMHPEEIKEAYLRVYPGEYKKIYRNLPKAG